MSNALDRCLEENRRRSGYLLERARSLPLDAKAAAGMSGYDLLATAAGTGGLTAFGAGTSLLQHREQLRHYIGRVFAAVRPIAQRIARQPWRVGRVVAKPGQGPGPSRSKAFWRRHRYEVACRKDVLPAWLKDHAEEIEVYEQHELLSVLAFPNPIMVGAVLKTITVVSMELTGKAYWWVQPQKVKGGGTSWSIWPLPASWVNPKHDGGLFTSYEVRPEGSVEPYTVSADEMVYFYYPDPSNPLGATSPLQAMARSVTADEAIQESQRRTFANGIWPGLALIVGRNPDITPGIPGQRPALTKEQRNQIMQAVKAAYRGVVHADEPLILDAIIQDVKRITNSPKEMDWLKSGGYTANQINLGYGVSSFAQGAVDNSTYAASAAADGHFLANCVNPKADLLSQYLTIFLGPKFARKGETLLVYVEEGKAIDRDADTRDWQFGLQNGCVSRNEYRQTRLGLPPVEGGDTSFVMGVGEVPVVREGADASGRADQLSQQQEESGDEEQKSRRRTAAALRRWDKRLAIGHTPASRAA